MLPDIVRAFAIDPAQASLLVSLFILPMALLTPLIGLVAERLTLRPVLLACLLVYGAAGLACMAAPSFPLLLALRIVQGTGAAALELFGLVILIETTTPEGLPAAIGRNAGVIGVTTAAAPLLSGLLALASWRASFLSAALAFPVALLVQLRLPRSPPPKAGSRPSVTGFLRRPAVLAALATSFVVFLFLFGVLLSFVPAQAARLGMRSALLVALVPTTTALAISVTAPFAAGRIGLWRRGRAELLAYLLYGAAVVGFGAASHPAVLLVAAALLGAGHGVLFPLVQSRLAKLSPPGGSVVFMSFNIAAIGLGQTLTPLIMSGVYELFGLRAVFAAAAALALLLAVACALARGGRGGVSPAS